METSITVVGESARAEVRSLYHCLADDDALRGWVRLEQPAPASGTLGGLVDVLVVGLGPSGAATALATVAITWLRRRSGNVTIKVTRPDGSAIEVTAEHVRQLDGDGIRQVIEQQSKLFLAPPPEDTASHE